jgi:hypothetical protein
MARSSDKIIRQTLEFSAGGVASVRTVVMLAA